MVKINVSDPDPDWIRIQSSQWIRNPGTDPRGQKWTTKIRKSWRNFMFWSAGCSLLSAEGFSSSWDVFYGRLGTSKFQFLIKKNLKILFSCKFFDILGHQNPGSGLVFSLNCLIRNQWIRIRNTGQHWQPPSAFLFMWPGYRSYPV
jgi:hypothetical protein